MRWTIFPGQTGRNFGWMDRTLSSSCGGSTVYTTIYLIPYLANNKFNTNFITLLFLKINSHQGEYMQAKVQKLDAQFKEDVPKVPDDV